MPKLIICRGIQGSGKTTWAKQWVLEDPEHRVRFNNDDIRNMLGKYWVPSREFIVTDLKLAFLHNAMLQGYDIVLDNMNLNTNEVDFLTKEVQENNSKTGRIKYEIEFQDFKTPLRDCIERDSKRDNPIGEFVIRATYKKYKSTFYCGDEKDS